MSISNIIDPLTRKFYPELLPPPPLNVPNLNQVLNAGNSASTIGDPQTIENLDELETQKIYQGNYLQLELGEAGDTVLLKGTTPLGNIFVGNGVSIEKLPLGPNNSVLVADSGQPLGVKWANETGDVESVSAGTNITLTGTGVNPIVNLSSPLTSSLNLGTQNVSGTTGSLNLVNVNIPVQAQVSVQASGISTYDAFVGSQIASMSKSGFTTQDPTGNLITIAPTSITKTGVSDLSISSATGIQINTPLTADLIIAPPNKLKSIDGFTTMEIGATGLEDAYVNGPVENKEVLTISALSVVDTISATDGGSYNNTATLTCSNTGIVEIYNSSNTAGTQGTVYTQALVNSSAVICGCSAPTTPPFPDISGNISMTASTTNGLLQITQSAPFAPSYTLNMDKDGIVQNNSSGNGFTITSNEQLNFTSSSYVSMTSTNCDIDQAGKLTIKNATVGGSANPLLVLQNNNNTAGATTFETYKNDQPTSTGGDNIASWSATCNTNIGKTEISRVNHIAYGTGAGNNDGGIALACKVNSSITNFMIANGGANAVSGINGELQVFKPITTTSPNNLNLYCPTAGGTIKLQSVSNIDLEATGDNFTTISGANTTFSTTSLGSQIEFKPEATAGKIVFTGASLQSNSSSGNSGEHLVITLNGVIYKIKLELP